MLGKEETINETDSSTDLEHNQTVHTLCQQERV